MNARKTCTTGLIFSLVSLALALPGPGLAADTGAEAVPVTYKPPLRGAPASRVGGGTRGAGQASFTLDVLAPDHTGLTTQAQPTLYWYASGPADGPVEVTVMAEGADKPVFERTLPATGATGVQSVKLGAQGVTLKPEVEYQWFVSVVRDPAQRSLDSTAGGTIRRVEADPATRARAAAANDRARAQVYAEAGLWYDAIDTLSRLIDRNPGDAGLRAERAALLEQVGLVQAAAADGAGSGRD